jgi:hypothetical protein
MARATKAAASQHFETLNRTRIHNPGDVGSVFGRFLLERGARVVYLAT